MIDADILLPTIDGWYRAGDLKVGDFLFDRNNLPCKVTALEFATPEEAVEIETDKGLTVRMSRDQGLRATYKKNNNPRSIDLRSLETGQFYLRRIPVPQAPERPQPIDPYLFGLWFFDVQHGKTTKVQCKQSEQDRCVTALRRSGFNPKKPKRAPCNKQYRWNVRVEIEPTIWQRLKPFYAVRPTTLPDEFIYASPDQKKGLLAGLFGAWRWSITSTKIKNYKIKTKTAEIALQLLQIFESLNYSAYVEERRAPISKKKVYSLHVNLRADPKRARIDKITSVKPISPIPMVGITVDSADESFYITEKCLPLLNQNAPKQEAGTNPFVVCQKV